jgi:predicted RNA-binding protein YlxR (DUF448 family)
MRSLKRIFNKIKGKNPYWSDYICFAEAVCGRKFSRKTIIRNFNSLVNKEEYAKNEKKEIIEHLVELSKYG